jgi:2-succinyl-5-enolpyruvyl-6-hydroxy-3-cyclohexene-1-carboxylate synthase
MTSSAHPSSAVPHDLDAMTSARTVVRGLAGAGVRHVVLCPGSRSAPLAYALAEAADALGLTVHVRIDERDAGFLAVGLAESTGTSVAVVTTSGTAVGELLPAVMEADHAAARVLVLSADRPAELHGTGANQTTQQADLFGTHVRASLSVAAGDDPSEAVRTAVGQANGDAETAPGPVQLNLCFRDPLTPLPELASGRVSPAAERPAAEPRSPRPEPVVPEHLSAADERHRTVVLAGHDAGAVASHFAAALNLPLLAEPSSGARFGPTAVGTYQYLLGALGEEIDTVVLFGRPTLSRPQSALLARADVTVWAYRPTPVAWFEKGRRRETACADLGRLASAVGPAPHGWCERWLTADARVRAALETVLTEHETAPGPLTGPGLATTVWEHAAGPLVLGSSRPIRDLDVMAAPRAEDRRRVFANRGLAGIDGTIATAAGVALGLGQRTLALMGDVTFLHDVGGLLTPSDEQVPDLDVIVAQDDGGSIFSTLEHGTVGTHASYTRAVDRFFRTPHSLAAAPIAAAYGWETEAARTRSEVAEWIEAGRGVTGRRLLEVPVEADDPRGLHLALTAAARQVLDASS